MRYSNENDKITSGTWTRHHKPAPKRAKKRGAKSKRTTPQQKMHTTVNITVLTRPQADCRIFNYKLAKKLVDQDVPLNKTNQFREEYTAQATLNAKKLSTPYTIRFINQKNLNEAKRLIPGTILQATGYFNERKGRTSAEFVVKTFEIVPRKSKKDKRGRGSSPSAQLE